MRKRPKQKRTEANGTRTSPRFVVGSRVRVKPGVADPDHPELPLGGWRGTIQEVERAAGKIFYEIRWDREVLERAHPVYRKRCERDALELEIMVLGASDLEEDTGAPLVLEAPAPLRPRPLSPDDEDDRIRAVYGLTPDDPLPEVDDESLETYHRYLAARLELPFDAEYTVESGPLQMTTHRVLVTGLVDPDEIEDHYGLLCVVGENGGRGVVPLGEIHVQKGAANHQLVSAYRSWFWSNR